MLSFVFIVITVTGLKFVKLEDTDEEKEDEIHDKIVAITHSIDINLRTICQEINKGSLQIAKLYEKLSPDDKKKELKNYLKTKVDGMLSKVKAEVVELVVLSGSRDRIEKAVAKHLGIDHMRPLVFAAAGLFPWHDELAAQLSSFAITYLYHVSDSKNPTAAHLYT